MPALQFLELYFADLPNRVASLSFFVRSSGEAQKDFRQSSRQTHINI
jgi:hypothetical protein